MSNRPPRPNPGPLRRQPHPRRGPRPGPSPRRGPPSRLARVRARGQGREAVETIARFAERMGPAIGRAEILVHRTRSSPLIAAAANAAASHFARAGRRAQRRGVPPGHVVFPRRSPWRRRWDQAAPSCSPRRWRRQVGIHVGEHLGRSPLPDLPHHRHRRHLRRRGRSRKASAPLARADAARVRVGRHAVRRPVGVPARRRPTPSNCTPRTGRAPGSPRRTCALEGYTGAAHILDGAQGLRPAPRATPIPRA